ncbi:MAG: hypothetical protein AAB562_00845 [Patescibacteria group bacterium]
MGRQNQQQGQGQKKSKKEKKVVPAPVHTRHTIDMTRECKARRVAKEIRKAQKKLAKRSPWCVKLRGHIADLKVMYKRLKAGEPAEVRTRADYAPRPASPDPAPAS